MRVRTKKTLLILSLALAALILTFVFNRWFKNREVLSIPEAVVEVEAVRPVAEGAWRISPEALERKPGFASVRVARLRALRVEWLAAEDIQESEGQAFFRLDALKGGDLLIRNPGKLTGGQMVIPRGLDNEKLLRLTIEAGVVGLKSRDLAQGLRFISPSYADDWGFTRFYMQELLKRAYREFDDLDLEMASDPEIRLQGKQAMVQAKVKVTAGYQGRRNYLLGNREEFNALVFQFENTDRGWKLVDLKGLRPLGFEERFFRLLGGDIGLPLNPSERELKKEACMPCRDRLAERFGPYKK